tara:strand:+ start:2792 stop:3088 length:297 start_codon:yes stop_codon:yes gene_type:complete
MKIIYVDIDGTICNTNGIDYANSEPKYEQIYKINRLYDEGNTIIYWTARGTVTKIDWLDLTKNQLDEWGVLYHDVRIGKPQYDIWIDDKSKIIEDLIV